MNPLLETARRYVASGLSVLPIATDGSKSPAPCIREWSPYQKRRPTEEELSRWFAAPAGIAVIFGAVSGNAECLDFDEPGLFDEYEQLAEDNGLDDLLRRLPMAETPSGGRHLYFRCETRVDKNTPLARIEDEVSCETKGARRRDGKYWKVRTRIETRGAGGYAIIPPSPAACHPEKRPYVLLRGSLTALPVLTEGERIALHRLARVFNAYQIPQPVEAKPKTRGRTSEGLSPGDDFDARGDVLELLQRHGAQVVGRYGETVFIKRPGKNERGHSATWNHGGYRYLCMFTSNWYPFEPERAYSPFAVYALLEHEGNFSAAAKALYAAGYGDRRATTSAASGSLPAPPELEEDAASAPTWEAWKKRGKRLAAWKQTNDDEFRWRVGDWWNTADVKWGDKAEFLKETFGEGRRFQIPKYATACKAFPPDKRMEGIPFWLYQELAAQSEEKRAQYLQKFKEGGLTRNVLRAELGTVPPKREPKGWLAVGKHLPVSLADELLSAIARDGSPVTTARVRAALGSASQFQEGHAAEEEYPPAWTDPHTPEIDAFSGHKSVPERDAENSDFLLKNVENGTSNSSAGGRIEDDKNQSKRLTEAPFSSVSDDYSIRDSLPRNEEAAVQVYKGGGQHCPLFEADPAFVQPSVQRHRREATSDIFDTSPAIVPLVATASQIAIADSIALQRKRGHDHTRKIHEDKGSYAKNVAVDLRGCRAEVVGVQWLESLGLPVSDWNPLADQAVSRPDVLLWQKVPLEIKSAAPGSRYFYVNEEQRERFAAYPGLYYLPLLMQDERTFIVCEPIPAEETATWKLLTPEAFPNITAPCRSAPVTCLKPLQSLDALHRLKPAVSAWKEQGREEVSLYALLG